MLIDFITGLKIPSVLANGCFATICQLFVIFFVNFASKRLTDSKCRVIINPYSNPGGMERCSEEKPGECELKNLF